MGEQEALLLKAKESLLERTETTGLSVEPGDCGDFSFPRLYTFCGSGSNRERQAIPLDMNEGIYIRDTQSGELRLVNGPQSYMLSPYKELWEKELPPVVEEVLDPKTRPHLNVMSNILENLAPIMR